MAEALPLLHDVRTPSGTPPEKPRSSRFSTPVPSRAESCPSILPASLPSTVTFHPSGRCLCVWKLCDTFCAPLRAVILLVLVILRIPVVLVVMLLPIPIKSWLLRGILLCGYPLYLTSLGKKYWNMCLSSMYGGGSCPRPHTVEIKPTRLSSCTIWPVPVVADNYAYIVVDHQTGICGIVDPGAGTPVSLACFQLGLIPRYIFLTHGHHDHAGGVEELVQQYPCIQVFCGEKETVLSVESKRLKDLSIFRLGRTRIVTVETPCHTPGSVVFGILRVFPNNVGSSSTDLLHRCEAAFTGDTLFLGGIGATFHGSDVDMWRSLQRLKHLPASCLVFPGHEYTESLRWFGAWLDPGNEKALMLAHEAQALRTVRRPTVPGVMGLERKVNPWLRLDETAFVNAVTERLRQYQAVPCCARMWTCMNYAPAAWYDITTPLGGRPESTRQSGEIKEMSMHVLPPLIRRQKQGADTPLRPLEHPASSSANYLSGRLDQKHVKSEKSQLREESVPELYWKLRYLQPLFEGLIPSRHFHLKGRSAASLAIQLQTESMVWADGHIYLTSDLFSRDQSTVGQVGSTD